MNVQKYSMLEVGNIIEHNRLSAARSNRDNVDPSLSHLNIDLLAALNKGREINGHKVIKNTLAHTKHQKRRDLNVAVSIVVSLPDNVPKSREVEFFNLMCAFFQQRYKIEGRNIISAQIHRDEPNARDHLHFMFVPISEREGVKRVCAGDVITRADLRTLHKDATLYLKAQGLEADLLTGATAGGNKSIQELKAQTLAEQIKKQQAEIDKLQEIYHKRKAQGIKDLEDIRASVKTLENNKSFLQKNIDSLQLEYLESAQKLERLKKEIFNLEGESFAPIFDQNEPTR